MRIYKTGELSPGLSNKREPTKLGTVIEGGIAARHLYAAQNVDISKQGYVQRRRGQSLAVAGNAHSLWADKKDAFAVIDRTLYKLESVGGSVTQTAIRQNMPDAPLSFSRGGDGEVYWTNGAEIRRVSAGVDRPAVTPPLMSVPVVTVTAGALPAGWYMLAFTVISADGESPATEIQRFNVPANSGFSIAGGDREALIYMTAPNGEDLFYAGKLPVSGAQVNVFSDGGRRCETANTGVIPAGQIVRHFQGRMLVAAGNVLYFSRPWAYGISDLRGYIPFADPITMVEPLDDGLYISSDKTFWIDNLDEGTLREVLPYGATPGTSGRTPDGKVAFWHSESGLVMGDGSGQVKPVQEDEISFSGAVSGASLYRESDGGSHILTSRISESTGTAEAVSFMDAEVINYGAGQ